MKKLVITTAVVCIAASSAFANSTAQIAAKAAEAAAKAAQFAAPVGALPNAANAVGQAATAVGQVGAASRAGKNPSTQLFDTVNATSKRAELSLAPSCADLVKAGISSTEALAVADATERGVSGTGCLAQFASTSDKKVAGRAVRIVIAGANSIPANQSVTDSNAKTVALAMGRQAGREMGQTDAQGNAIIAQTHELGCDLASDKVGRAATTL